MRLTDRDINILLKVHQCGWLSTRQIKRYFFANATDRAVTKRLRLLSDNGYVYVKQRARTEQSYFRLGNKGRIVLAEQTFHSSLHKVILREIHKFNPNLTIMMSRRKGIFQKLRGSIAERVARDSPTSVVIIRSPIKDWTTYGDHLEPRKIIIPIGTDSPCELFATQLAIALANAGKARDAEITLLHVLVVPETVPLDTTNDEMLKEEHKFIKQAGKFSTLLLFPMKSKVIVGRDIGRSVSHYVNKVHADLVVMGVPYLPRKILGLYGTDTNEIYHKSKCPVVMLFRRSC